MTPEQRRAAAAGLIALKPGDILFTRITRPRSAALLVKAGQLILGERVRLGPVSIDHVLVVTEPARAVTFATHPVDDVLTGPAGDFYTLPLGVQAMPGGAEVIALTPEQHWQPWCAYARLPEDYPGQAGDAAKIADYFAKGGIRYSFGSYALLALWRFGLRAERLARYIDRRDQTFAVWLPSGRRADIELPAEAICSVLADQAWSLAGKDVVTGTRSQIVTPGRLALQLWRRSAGVTWSGPTID